MDDGALRWYFAWFFPSMRQGGVGRKLRNKTNEDAREK
jgi:hypothetical protein